MNEHWILCPICGNKTRLKIREDTELKNFPLYCPKCKQETLINVRQLNISVIKEPDAQPITRKEKSLWLSALSFMITTMRYTITGTYQTPKLVVLAGNDGCSVKRRFLKYQSKPPFSIFKNENTEGVLKSPFYKDMAVSREASHGHRA